MKLFSEFLGEDAGDKIRNMSDAQVADLKRKNPGAAKKIDDLRGVKSKPAAAKPEPKKELSGDKGGDITKKPDLRKSQLGKWSQGVKSNPTGAKKSGDIVKSDGSKPVSVKDKLKAVASKAVEDEKQAGKRPGTTKGGDMADKQRARINKNTGPDAMKAVKNLAKKAKGFVKKGLKGPGDVGVSQGDDQAGLSGRDKGLIG